MTGEQIVAITVAICGAVGAVVRYLELRYRSKKAKKRNDQ